MTQTFFDRIEDKYIITQNQYHSLTTVLTQYGQLDKYGNYPISSVYFDNTQAQLAQQSILFPLDNQKLRLRQYSHAAFCENHSVMFELKERINGRIRKTRTVLPFADFLKLSHNMKSSQIPDVTLDTLLRFQTEYQLIPQLLIQYFREAYYFDQTPDLRITFDTQICCFPISSPGEMVSDSTSPLLSSGQYLLEIKYDHEIPSWLTDFLQKNQIYKTEYSKYVSAYKLLFSQISG